MTSTKDKILKMFEEDNFGDLMQKSMILNFITQYYVFGDIQKFKEELDNIQITTISNGDEDYTKKIEMPLVKLKIINEMIATKKIVENQQDLVVIANILLEVAGELSKIGIEASGFKY